MCPRRSGQGPARAGSKAASAALRAAAARIRKDFPASVRRRWSVERSTSPPAREHAGRPGRHPGCRGRPPRRPQRHRGRPTERIGASEHHRFPRLRLHPRTVPISGEPVTVYDPAPRRSGACPIAAAQCPRSPCAPATWCDAEVFRTTGTGFASAPVEGRMPLALQGDWQPEPQAPDSLVAWGYFNAHFEHKESVEPYVTEIFAQQRQGLRRAGAAKAPVRPRKRIPLTTLRWLDQRPPRCPVLGRCGTSRGHSSTVRSPLPRPCRRAGAAAVARSAGHALA